MGLLGVVGVLLWKGDFRYRCVPDYLLSENSSWYQEHCESPTQCQFQPLDEDKGDHGSKLWSPGFHSEFA